LREKTMGYELVGKPRVVSITKKIAEQWRDMPTVESDRNLSLKRVDAYKKMAVQGLFRPITWARAVCMETRETYRVNGKHTSVAMSDMESVPEGIVAVVEEYHCDTMRDVVALYNTYDSRIQMRSTNDINKSFAAVDPELHDVPLRVISRCITAMSLKRWRMSYDKVSAQERAEMIFEPDGKAFIRWCYETLGDTKSSRRMCRAPVMWAMYDTWLRSHKDATEFWLAVRDETGVNNKLPDRKLSRWLHENSTDAMGRTRGTYEMYAKCIIAWNSWRSGTATDLKYFAKAGDGGEMRLPSAK
jgi:hypothetical protein